MRKFFTKKRVIWAAVVILIAGPIVYRIFKPADTSKILTETVAKKDLKQTVLATGQVTSSIDLDLNFKATGRVSRINVKVGDKVRSGQVLATLDQEDQSAALTTAKGALASAQASYEKVLAGASTEEIDVYQKAVDAAQTSLDSTIKQQAVLVNNARIAMFNAGLTATATDGPSYITVSGTYSSDQEGAYYITAYATSSSGNMFNFGGLESGTMPVSTSQPVPLGTRGLYVQFIEGYPVGVQFTINVPNKAAASYLTYSNAYKAALETQDAAIAAAKAALDSAIAQLNLKKAQARPADVQAAEAQILSAQGQVQTAQSALENTIIRAPAAGTITAVNIKYGEQSSASSTDIVLQDVGNLHLEANVSEANISDIQPGQPVDVTYDALGPDKKFKATVEFVDPSSTVVSGVVNYKVTSSIEPLAEIKPGMTANLTILTAEKSQILSISQRAILNHDNKKFVRVITDPKKKTYAEQEVTTGLEADGGLIEITSGLTAGQEIVTFIKQ